MRVTGDAAASRPSAPPRRGTRVAATVFVLLITLLALGAGVRPVAAAAPSDWWGGVGTFPTNHTVGTSMYSGGTWSYADRYGDATGANADGKHREDYFGAAPGAGQDFTYDFFGTHRLASNGDSELPSDNVQTPVGTADIIFYQMRQAADGLEIRVVFAALGTGTILTLGIDNNGEHGAATPFPHNAALNCGSCGIDRFVTVWSTGGDVRDSAGTVVGTPQRMVTDLTDNAVVFVVPTAALGATSPIWRLWLAAGVSDGAGGYSGFNGNQATGSPRQSSDSRTGVFDLAFSPDNRRTVDDRAQADLLASGRATDAVAEVDMVALASGTSRVDNMPGSGPVEQILVSSLNLGEGTDNGSGPAQYQVPEPASVYHYLGRLQPYLVYLPSGYDPSRPTSTAISLHGYNGYYDEAYFELQSFPTPYAQPDGFIGRLDRAGMVAVFPLGRGDIQYNRDGEKDVLEVIADAEQHFAVDPARLHLVGLSMGGAGSWQIGEHHPDLFADIAPALPNTVADTLNTEVVQAQALGVPLPPVSALSPQAGIADQDALPNLLNTPTFVLTAMGDSDAGAVARLYYGDLRDIGAEAHIKSLLRQTHSFEILRLSYDELFTFWASHRTVATPPRVTYVDHTSWSYPQFGVIDDGAYWVHGLAPVPTDLLGGGIGRIDAEALTLPRRLTSTTESTSTGGDLAAGTAYLRSDAQPRPTESRPTANALALTMTKLGAAGIDLTRLAVDFSRPYCVGSTGDRAVEVSLTGGVWTDPTISGVPATVSTGHVVLHVPAGRSYAVVSPRGSSASATDACAALRPGGAVGNSTGPSLPTTSRGAGGAWLPAASIIAVAAILLLQWRARRRVGTRP